VRRIASAVEVLVPFVVLANNFSQTTGALNARNILRIQPITFTASQAYDTLRPFSRMMPPASRRQAQWWKIASGIPNITLEI
jgi:hypothetical protein